MGEKKQKSASGRGKLCEAFPTMVLLNSRSNSCIYTTTLRFFHIRTFSYGIECVSSQTCTFSNMTKVAIILKRVYIFALILHNLNVYLHNVYLLILLFI